MTQTSHARRAFQPGSVRLAALVLTALTLFASLTLPPARAAEWMEPYLEQVQAWGVMRGDANGNLNEDRAITRAEFVTMVNRAFGYKEVGPNPFSDVDDNDWYAEDIRIAHQAGYFQGTNDSTAAPLNLVTREQAAAFLGRCLRFQGVTGAANSTFTDMEEIGGWSRGLVQEAADLGIIQGYSDGSFHPKDPITRGQLACFLVRALGTLIQEPGEQTTEGGVYGNLTITTPGVKLKDTTITGNLYLTGGVGLGNVELENVEVLGKIVICGTGEAENGENSVVLRNVTAGSLEVDPLTEQFLSVQAEGLTNIGEATLRSSAYLEDRTEDGLGFQTIRLDGPEDATFQLAGNIKQVTNLTPGSTLQIAQGVADRVTVDEKARESSVIIDNIAYIRELNLDTATEVTGDGSITHLNVNAPDSTVSMLPDTIYVRPGIISNINKVDMDNKTATESSEDPRILAGYPAARNIAPTSAEAVFRTNKSGTIRWAITALMDGSVGEEELLNPSGYPKIIRSGTINATASNTDFTARLTGLTKQGSYYISALLEDARGRKSPVKVAAFTTPDDTAPNFASGYPQAPILTLDSDGEQVAQIMVMPTKDCQLYYALFPKGSTAPTAADFRSGALSGNLGSGVVSVKKNTPFLISRINTSYLQEKTDYDLYLWLNDADNGKSSAVRRVTITTKDITPPTITNLYVKTIAARSVTMSFSLDEPGSLYWVVMRKDAPFYQSGIDKDNPSRVGKIQIQNGTPVGGNPVRRGGPNRAARAGTEYNFTISGLDSQTTYDLYYVAVDTAGNFCEYSAPLIPPMEIHTLDEEPPTVTQEFTNDSDGSTAARPTPYPDSTVRLVFSETVIPIVNNNGIWEAEEPNFENAYRDAQGNDAAKQLAFANLLRNHIKLYHKPATGRTTLAAERTAANESLGNDWVIDYRNATVSRDAGTGEMIIAFPYNTAIKLGSGETYYFVVSNVADNSNNRMNNSAGSREGYQLPDFTVVDVEVNLQRTTTLEAMVDGQRKPIDMAFELDSPTASSATSDTKWDMLIWYTAPVPAASSVEFELYYSDNGSSWVQAGGAGKTATIQTFTGEERTGISVGKHFNNYEFETLQTLRQREYGIKIVKVGTSSDEADWSFPITFEIRIVAADQGALRELATPDLTPKLWEANQAGDVAVNPISKPVPFTVTHTFSDQNPPRFINNYPQFTPSDESVNITIMLNRSATTCYYVIAPLNTIPTTYNGNPIRTPTEWATLEEDGFNFNDTGDKGLVTSPLSNDIMNPQYPNDQIKTGSIGFSSGATDIPTIQGLLTNKEYIAYFVLRGEGLNTYSGVYAFRFKTDPITRPIMQIDLAPPSGSISEYNNRDANGGWLLFPDTNIPQQLQQTVGANLNIGTTEEDVRYSNLWDPSWSSLTLLEAMQRYARNGNTVVGTVFDLFVLKDTQDRIGDSIVRGTYSGQNGGLTLTSRNQILNQNYTQWMSPGVNYYLVAAAKNPQGSAYGITAAYRLYTRDGDHPKISGIATSTGQFFKEAIDAQTASYSGVMQILFDETLYWKSSEDADTISKLANAMNPSTATNPLPSGTPSHVTNYQSVMALLNPGPLGLDRTSFDNPSSGSPYPDCTVLYFTFDGLKLNTPVSLNTSSLCDVNSNAGFGDRNIQLQLELVRTQEGTYTAQFVISSSNVASWAVNGRPSYSY